MAEHARFKKLVADEKRRSPKPLRRKLRCRKRFDLVISGAGTWQQIGDRGNASYQQIQRDKIDKSIAELKEEKSLVADQLS
jgi:hypothetical protein